MTLVIRTSKKSSWAWRCENLLKVLLVQTKKIQFFDRGRSTFTKFFEFPVKTSQDYLSCFGVEIPSPIPEFPIEL